MALNKLKKWIGTQLWSTFMTEYNDNVDATNAAIDLAEQNAADISSLDPIPISKTLTITFTDGYATVSASNLGVNSVSAHYWIVQGYYTDGAFIIVPRLYSNSMALYAYSLPGMGRPSADLPVTFTRDP